MVTETKSAAVKCPLCGLVFRTEDSESLCSKCPLSRFCKLLCCPNCGYKFPGDVSVIVDREDR